LARQDYRQPSRRHLPPRAGYSLPGRNLAGVLQRRWRRKPYSFGRETRGGVPANATH